MISFGAVINSAAGERFALRKETIGRRARCRDMCEQCKEIDAKIEPTSGSPKGLPTRRRYQAGHDQRGGKPERQAGEDEGDDQRNRAGKRWKLVSAKRLT